MKIKLPDGSKIKLPDDNTMTDRIEIVERLLLEQDEMILENYSSQQVKYFLEGCSNYIIWYIEGQWTKEKDGDIIHKDKHLKINKYDKKNIPFSMLSMEDKIRYGIEDNGE